MIVKEKVLDILCPNKGCRLKSASDALSENTIRKFLKAEGLNILIFDSVDSTNTVLKALAEENAAKWTVVVANEQTAGRGRMGRSFFSPGKTGLYMSVLLRPKLELNQAHYITTCAAVAVAEAIEDLSGERAEIKWVNDIYMRNKKVCGILTETAIAAENQSLNYAILGIGINILPPDTGFPTELKNIAAPVFSSRTNADFRNVLAASILNKLSMYCKCLSEKPFLSAYRERLMLIGNDVDVFRPGTAPVRARVLGVSDDFSLIVEHRDGALESLFSGEVSVRNWVRGH